jgi:hypothetical protein
MGEASYLNGFPFFINPIVDANRAVEQLAHGRPAKEPGSQERK